jgi:G3E family GTPase
VDAIPVTVVTGFLGAGKSTLLLRWLEELPREQTAVIVNEQGAVGIDGALLSQHANRLREITGGCVCCVTQAALEQALIDFADSEPAPTRILVETSGAASPAGVIRALTQGDARDRLRLDGVVTVLDAARARRALEFGLTIEQLGFADVVAVSHVDACTEDDLVALEHDLAAYAPGAVIARARRGVLEGTLLQLLDARGGVLRVPSSDDRGVARHGIDAASFAHDGEVDEQRFGDWVEETLGAVEARILRIKGILAVRGVDERVIVQGVGEAVEVTMGAPWGDARRTSRLVVLGLALDEASLRAGFSACAIGAVLQGRDAR